MSKLMQIINILFIFKIFIILNIVIKKEEQNNYSIYSSKNPDIFISPIELFENLKNIFKKENQKI